MFFPIPIGSFIKSFLTAYFMPTIIYVPLPFNFVNVELKLFEDMLLESNINVYRRLAASSNEF
jgi:hypothetical protein